MIEYYCTFKEGGHWYGPNFNTAKEINDWIYDFKFKTPAAVVFIKTGIIYDKVLFTRRHFPWRGWTKRERFAFYEHLNQLKINEMAEELSQI